ncbi:MAG: sigma-54 dependent transcriptional regulator [Planctomycetes bacterium]|nr:sigma-54 dependent transcriptional regulator [Planctomycetota bacterium]
MSSASANPADAAGSPIRVLIVDDDEAHAQAVAESLARIGCDCTVATSGEQGSALIEGETWDVVVTDLRMEDIDGLAILQKTKQELPESEVILLTGHASIQSALAAGQGGAYTYLTKPLDVNELRTAVEKAASRLVLIRRNAELRQQLDEKFGFEGVVGSSPAMHKVLESLKHVAPTEATVLIEGENGTGKELVARALHQNSPRKNKRFVPVNISAIPETILESELFGHEPGSFTGATGRRIGKFEYANGGTLFLDEVGEMPIDTQIKLLRVLEDRKVTRLGSNEEISVNVRVVAATNADLKRMVDDKRFRIDLYHRLHVVSLRLPPLRERRGDIALLMDHFVRELRERTGKEVNGFSRAARQAMMMYDWPGNVRELRNSIERMLVLDQDGLLDVDDLPEEIAAVIGEDGDGRPGDGAAGADGLIGRPLTDVERYYIQRALELSGGKREEAASMLGIGERTLYRKIKEYGLRNP